MGLSTNRLHFETTLTTTYIGRFQPTSRDTNNNREMYLRLLVDEQKTLMRDLLFSSTNMTAMTSHENLLFVLYIYKVLDVNFHATVNLKYVQYLFTPNNFKAKLVG